MKNFVVVDQLRSILDPETNKFLNSINKKNVQTFYLGMEFNKIDNAEVYNQKYYPLNLTLSSGRTPFYTPQINGISSTLPSSPILYDWNNVPKVNSLFFFFFNFSREKFSRMFPCIFIKTLTGKLSRFIECTSRKKIYTFL